MSDKACRIRTRKFMTNRLMQRKQVSVFFLPTQPTPQAGSRLQAQALSLDATA